MNDYSFTGKEMQQRNKQEDKFTHTFTKRGVGNLYLDKEKYASTKKITSLHLNAHFNDKDTSHTCLNLFQTSNLCKYNINK